MLIWLLLLRDAFLVTFVFSLRALEGTEQRRGAQAGTTGFQGPWLKLELVASCSYRRSRNPKLEDSWQVHLQR